MGNLAGQWTYTYDHAGRIASIVPPNPVPEQGLGGDYGYNWLGQLTNPPADPNHLTYNPAGLLSTWPGMYSYTYKANGVLDQIKSPSGTVTIASCSYDTTGFPIELSGGGVTVDCTWDADGRFVGYAETAGGSESESWLIDPIARVGSRLIDNASGGTVSYVCDPQGCVVSGVSSAGQTDYHSDGDGQIQASTGCDGTVAATYVCGTDGEVVSTSDPVGDGTVSGQTGLLAGEAPFAGGKMQALSWHDGWLDGSWGEHIPILGGLWKQAGTDFGHWQTGHGSGWRAAGSGLLAAGGTIAAAVGIEQLGALGVRGVSGWLARRAAQRAAQAAATTAIVPLYNLTRHAAEQMAEREITTGQLDVVMTRGQTLWDPVRQTLVNVIQTAGQHVIYAPYDPVTRNVITVIYAGKYQEGWDLAHDHRL